MSDKSKFTDQVALGSKFLPQVDWKWVQNQNMAPVKFCFDLNIMSSYIFIILIYATSFYFSFVAWAIHETYLRSVGI